jgi:hypothetical protein
MPNPWEEELREGFHDCPGCEPGGKGALCEEHAELADEEPDWDARGKDGER